MTTIRTEREEAIRCVAYRLWEEEGRPEGRQLDHYFTALALWEKDQERLEDSPHVTQATNSEPAHVRPSPGRKQRPRSHK
ncbi:MAG: DUF2934 domain-containing protein [Chloroflexi bacterium]|nr:DUF2934 domain-containing protein [Chloroflexota bacterium]